MFSGDFLPLMNFIDPLRLAVSGSCFLNAMQPELLKSCYKNMIDGRLSPLTPRQNLQMSGFLREIVDVCNRLRIPAFECYHSPAYDLDMMADTLLEARQTEFWSVHGPFGAQFDASSPDESIIENTITGYAGAITLAVKLGAKIVVTHPGANVQYDVTKQTRLARAAETIARLAPIAAEYGVKLAVEPLPKHEAGNSLEEVLWIVEQVNQPNVGINFDVNHLYPAEIVPGKIREAGGKILSVHISDQDGQERHWLPFEGILDWQAVLAALQDAGYRGPLVYETHIRDIQTCDEVGRIIVENYKKLIKLAPSAIIQSV